MSTRITTRYLSATDTKGSRIRVTWKDDNGATRTYTEGFDHSAYSPYDDATERALGNTDMHYVGSNSTGTTRVYEVSR